MLGFAIDLAIDLAIGLTLRNGHSGFGLRALALPGGPQNSATLDFFNRHNDVSTTQNRPPIGAQFIDPCPTLKPLRFV